MNITGLVCLRTMIILLRPKRMDIGMFSRKTTVIHHFGSVSFKSWRTKHIESCSNRIRLIMSRSGARSGENQSIARALYKFFIKLRI